MRPINTTPSYTPKCPNHGVKLEGCGFPLPPKGEGICPVSGAHFAFEVDHNTSKMVKGKDGETQKSVDWKIEGKDGIEET